MTIKRVSDKQEVLGIKRLQSENLKGNLTAEEMQREGFLTAEYTLEFLETLNAIEPSIIAVDNDKVVGYALVVTKKSIGHHGLLDDLFRQVDNYSFNGDQLKDTNYVLVGQLCVAKTHRRIGVVQGMYDFYRKALWRKYNYCVTDVDEKNPRSIKSHLKTGFGILGTITYAGNRFYVVIWDWRRPGISAGPEIFVYSE
jgi:acetyltransferase (GNAT) family protein